MAAIPQRGSQGRRCHAVVVARYVWFAAGRHVLGSGRDGSVPDRARSRADLSDFCNWRHVLGCSRNERFPPVESSRISAFGKPAYGGRLLPPRDDDGDRIRGDDFGVCGRAIGGRAAPQRGLCQNDATTI